MFCNNLCFCNLVFNSIREIIDNTKDKPTLKLNRFYLSDLHNNHLTYFYQLSLIKSEKNVILISNTESVIFLLNFHAGKIYINKN